MQCYAALIRCQFELANAVMKDVNIVILPGSYSGAEDFCESDVDPLHTWVPVDQTQAKYMSDKDVLLALIDKEIEGG